MDFMNETNFNIKKYIYILVVFVLLFSPKIVSAEGNESADSVVSSRARLQQRINTVKEKIELKRDERQENREQQRIEFAKKHVERITKRFGEYYERLNKIIAKVETKVANNSLAKAKLSEAKSKLAEAKTLSDEAIGLFSEITTGNLGSNDENVSNAKEKANSARQAFVDTLKLIGDAVKIAKGNE